MNITREQLVGEAALGQLGFTEVEARLYCTLLGSGPSTAYRLAQLTGKAAPNAYQALANLASKGAVLVGDGEPRIFRAAAPEELTARLAERFDLTCRQADAALATLARPVRDDRIYQVKSPGQVLERARSMLASAKEIVLFDLFDEPFEALAPMLAAAADRGVVVAGLVYGPVIPPAKVLARRASSETSAIQRWPGRQLTIVVDASEYLVALMGEGLTSVKRALWSDSVYLACLQHSGLSAEIRLTAVPEQPRALQRLALLEAAPRGLHALLDPPVEPSSEMETAG